MYTLFSLASAAAFASASAAALINVFLFGGEGETEGEEGSARKVNNPVALCAALFPIILVLVVVFFAPSNPPPYLNSVSENDPCSPGFHPVYPFD